MQHSPSWEANWYSSSQEIPRIFWDRKVHYRLHKCSPLIHILRHINPVHKPTSHFLKIHINIILLHTPGSSKWSFSFRFPHQNPVYTTTLPHTCYMPRPSQSSRFDRPIHIWWTVSIIKLLTVKFSPFLCYLVPLWPKYSPQCPILKHTQSTPLPHCEICYKYWMNVGPGSSVGTATGYGLDVPGIESRWGARYSAPIQTDLGVHPASCTMGTEYFPGVKSGRGVTLTPHPFLVPWSWKGRAIPLLPLWAVRPVQSLSACTRVHFTSLLPFIKINACWLYRPINTQIYINNIFYTVSTATSFDASASSSWCPNLVLW